MKRLIALLLVSVITISLCACNDTQEAVETDPSSITNTTGDNCTHLFDIIRSTERTCIQSGSITSVCRQCGEETTEQLPALGHDYSSGICQRCGAEMPGYEETPEGCAHAYSMIAQTAPTCSAEGSFTYACGNCGNTYTETIKAKDHVYADATCNTPKTCLVCNATDGKALGHSYADGSCTRCGAADPSVPEKVTCTVTVRTDKGALVEGVTVSIFTDSTTSAAVGRTNNAGVATVPLVRSERYTIILSDVPDGLSAKESYIVQSPVVNINLTSVPYTTPTDHSKGNYKVGSIMGEFTLADTDGNSYTLSQLLRDKELIILNFWFVNCGPCKAEFPYFEAAYKKYADQLQLLTLNHFDTEAQIIKLRQDMGMTFPMIAEDIGFQQGFGITAYPTTVFIDSSGKILKIQVGEFESQTELDAMIERFLK